MPVDGWRDLNLAICHKGATNQKLVVQLVTELYLAQEMRIEHSWF